MWIRWSDLSVIFYQWKIQQTQKIYAELESRRTVGICGSLWGIAVFANAPMVPLGHSGTQIRRHVRYFWDRPHICLLLVQIYGGYIKTLYFINLDNSKNLLFMFIYLLEGIRFTFLKEQIKPFFTHLTRA